MQTGDKYVSRMTVNDSHTAQTIGSGDMPVLATPAMVALMENAAMNVVAAQLPSDSTTVGTELTISHLKASPIGAAIEAEATLTAIDGRKLSFDVVARQGETIRGKGTHVRYIVERERFMAKCK